MAESKPTVLMIASQRSFLSAAINEKLVMRNIDVDVIYNTDALQYAKEASAVLLFADDELTKSSATLEAIAKKASERDMQFFIVGDSGAISRCEKVFQLELIQRTFLRPVDVNEVTEAVVKYLQFYKSTNRKKLLVVDDSGSSLRITKSWFEARYKVMLANSVAMAIRIMSSDKPDLILLDCDMPICDGKMAYEMIKAEPDFSDIPIMFLTGQDNSDEVKKMMELHPQAYLLKSYDAAKIVGEVDDFFKRTHR